MRFHKFGRVGPQNNSWNFLGPATAFPKCSPASTNDLAYLSKPSGETTTTTPVFSRTTWVSRHQKGKPFWILLQQEMMGWQWHQLDHMQIICTPLQRDNHASTSPLSFYGPDALHAAQPKASKHLAEKNCVLTFATLRRLSITFGNKLTRAERQAMRDSSSAMSMVRCASAM